jgi:hypothetical protein
MVYGTAPQLTKQIPSTLALRFKKRSRALKERDKILKRVLERKGELSQPCAGRDWPDFLHGVW